MQVNVRFLDNLRLEASFDDFQVITDQPIRYKGDGSAPGPFDYFLASSALCAAYFVKVYCKARNIPTDDIHISQDNIIDPENRYQQTLVIRAQIPESISEKDQKGIIASMERCTVKRVIQNSPDFKVETITNISNSIQLDYQSNSQEKTMITGKDLSLEDTITQMTALIAKIGIKLEIASWRNIVPHIWSVHIRDADAPMCFSNGKGATKDAALCSALGEFLERLSTNFFYNDFFLGENIASSDFVHYPNEKWFQPGPDNLIPAGLMDENFLKIYNPDGELNALHLIDTNSGSAERGICALPYVRQSDQETIYVPVNLIGNIFVSNGMSAGNTITEARVQALSEIFERAVKNKIIQDELTLPNVPQSILERYPKIIEGIEKLEAQGFPIFVKDASLGGKFPVINVTLMNPKTGGVYASFGAHPKFEVALERTLTELMQGRSFEGLNDVQMPTFNENAVKDHSNLVEHFIDSTGIISWKFFAQDSDYDFCDWNFKGSTAQEYAHLMDIAQSLGKEIYIADYEELGAKACRILIPGYSDIYEPEDLVWDNHNKALLFREDILHIHTLDEHSLKDLLEKLDQEQIDDYLLLSELIGVDFDENTVWGRCTVGELKGLIHLALRELPEAKSYVDMFMTYNDNLASRRTFYQLMQIILDIQLREDLALEQYKESLERMYGKDLLEEVIKCASGQEKFTGLTPTNMRLENLERHQKLITSYQKIQKVKKQFFKEN